MYYKGEELKWQQKTVEQEALENKDGKRFAEVGWMTTGKYSRPCVYARVNAVQGDINTSPHRHWDGQDEKMILTAKKTCEDILREAERRETVIPQKEEREVHYR